MKIKTKMAKEGKKGGSPKRKDTNNIWNEKDRNRISEITLST